MLRLLAVAQHAPRAHQDAVRTLMTEYAAMPHTLGRWTTASADLAALPFPFVPPHGTLLLAEIDTEPVGCGALRIIAPGIGEVKRMYVRPASRGRGVGEALLRGLLSSAQALALDRVRLDTAPELSAAQALYRRIGFVSIPRYLDEQLPDALCFERPVRTAGYDP